MALYNTAKIDEVTTAFPVGTVVKAFRDGVYSWKVGTVTKIENDNTGSPCSLHVNFMDGVTINYPFSMISASDIPSSFVQKTAKSVVVDELYPISCTIMYREQCGYIQEEAWSIGHVTKKRYDPETHELLAIIIRIVDKSPASIPLSEFEDNGQHVDGRLRIIRPRG
jgi:hypothetical protein